MATQRVLSRLQALLELDRCAIAQAQVLAATFSTVIQAINAIKDNVDIEWQEEVLAEETTGSETEFHLLHPPMKLDSVVVYVDGSSITAYTIDLDTGIITPTETVPAGKRITASYVQLGLTSQVVEILTAIPAVSLSDIAGKIQDYEVAIAWLMEHFPA